MSSPPKENNEIKGGHLPAVKAGGRRIVQKHQVAHSSEPPQEKEKDEEEFESSSPPKPSTLIVSGAVTKGDKDFTPAAAQVAHQKPQASVSKLPTSHHLTQHIHQPRK